MITCTLCKSQLEEGTEGAIAVLLKKYVDTAWNGDWDRYSVGSKLNFNGYTAEVVKVRDSWNDSGTGDDYSYLHQGQTFEAYVIVKVGEYFYKQTGTGDSYGEVSWDGEFGPVQMKAKTVTVYDF